MKSVLNVGGGSKSIPIPTNFSGWNHVLLDINPEAETDVQMDARELLFNYEETFDAVYCAHNLEHFYIHEVNTVLRGFIHVLKPDGFAQIHVPDIHSVMKFVVKHNLDLHEPLYTAGMGPISAHDILYGHGREVASGNQYYAHKTGFTIKSLNKALGEAGFTHLRWFQLPEAFECRTIAFKRDPTTEQLDLLGLT